jgi:hypothetical protein
MRSETPQSRARAEEAIRIQRQALSRGQVRAVAAATAVRMADEKNKKLSLQYLGLYNGDPAEEPARSLGKEKRGAA